VGKLDFGRLGRVIGHAIDKFIELIIETRKGFNQYAFLYNASGDDSVPCEKDRVIIVKIDGTGRYIACGILNESQGAKPGEKIFFARDTDGKIVSKITMLNDGSINTKADGDITSKNKGDVTGEVDGKMTMTITGDITFEGKGTINEKTLGDTTRGATENYTIKAQKIELVGSAEIILKTIGSALWCPNGVTNCFFCNAPHGGPAMGITGLKGG
jgi:hypothetical protein